MMSVTETQIVESKLKELQSLTPAQRVLLAERLIEETPLFIDTSIEHAWAAEVERRRRDYEQGRARGIPASEVFAATRKRLGMSES